MPINRDDAEERKAGIKIVVEELRLNTKDLREQAKQAIERARQRVGEAHAVVETVRASRTGKKR